MIRGTVAPATRVNVATRLVGTMMKWWTDRQRRKSLLNAFHFDTTCWLIEKDEHALREWSNGYGETLRARVRALVPGTGASSHDLKSLRDFYRKEANGGGGGIVRADVASAAGMRAVVVVQKRRGGLAYKGSLIVPLQNFEY